MSKILITGASGFLGSHLLTSFVINNFDVVVLKRSTSNLWRINHLKSNFKSYNIDQISIEKIFDIEKPSIVVHTACSYGRNSESINSILQSNLIFGIQVFEASIKSDVKIFINSGSLLPRTINNYSLSKAQFSDWLKKFSDKIKVVNFKIEHMYGPKDDDNKFLGWLIKKMISEKSKINLTSGIQKRDFIFIDDVVEAFQLVLSKIDYLSDYNEFHLATGNFIDVRKFVELIAVEIESYKGIQILERLNFGAISYRKGDVMIPVLDNTSLKKIGWQPKYDIKKGIKKILKYYL